MHRSLWSAVSVFALAVGTSGNAQEMPVNYNLFGGPGLLEMPSARTPEEGTLGNTLSYREGQFQTTLNFQLTERLSGSFRFAFGDLYDETATDIIEDEFNRGFDLQYTLLQESDYAPEIAIGLRDFLTPGRLQSEYVVASKQIGDALAVTAGLGWGAMGTRDGFDNPISSRAVRPVFDEDTPEGQLASDQWFAGDAAFFGGIEYQINDRWGVVAEYSSIAYPQVPFGPALNGDSPYSLGVTYRPTDGMQLSLAALNGQEIAVSGTFFLNANNRPGMSGIEPAPVPVRARSNAELDQTTWDRSALPAERLQSVLATTLESEGITLHALELTDRSARVRFSNQRYRTNAQALGRVARMMTQVMPASVEVFVLEPQANGIPLSAVRIARSDLETLENRSGAAEALYARTAFSDAGGDAGLVPTASDAPAFSWGLSPYFSIDPFSSSGSIGIDGGLSLNASYRITPQLVVSGAIVQSLFRNDGADPGPDSTPDLQNVRTDGGFYGDDGIPVMESLAITHYGRPGADLYSRISFGYLERMFGGVSSELLWKPVGSAFGLGAEVNLVAQRNTDMGFGFDEYDYTVATGHLSAYYDFGNGYHTQVDVGRYLAGDWGATLRVAREYDNGVRIGAYVSQTDVTYEEFGDGSYNKGISVSLPQDFLTGRASRGAYGTTLSTRSGDGGARLNVGGRLYETVRGSHQADLSDNWGRFWR